MLLGNGFLSTFTFVWKSGGFPLFPQQSHRLAFNSTPLRFSSQELTFWKVKGFSKLNPPKVKHLLQRVQQQQAFLVPYMVVVGNLVHFSLLWCSG